jgi:hypothetical protein
MSLSFKPHVVVFAIQIAAIIHQRITVFIPLARRRKSLGEAWNFEKDLIPTEPLKVDTLAVPSERSVCGYGIPKATLIRD